MRKNRFNLLSPTAIGVALLGLSSIAQAASISATATWTLDGVNGTGSPDNQSLVGAGSVDILDGDSDVAGNNVFYHTFGNTSGTFGSRVSGSGNFDILGEFNFAETYQNTASTDQSASFSFTVIPGELDVNFFGSALGAADFIRSAYEIDIRLNGASIFDSAATVERTAAGPATFTETGTSIGGAFNVANERYSWNAFSATLDLGVIAAGDTFLLEYDMRTTASSSLIGASDCTGGFGGGDGDGEGVDLELAAFAIGDDEGPGSGGACGSAIARSGDPFDPSFLSNVGSVSGATAVPEPAPLLLLGLGLAGMLRIRRKQA